MNNISGFHKESSIQLRFIYKNIVFIFIIVSWKPVLMNVFRLSFVFISCNLRDLTVVKLYSLIPKIKNIQHKIESKILLARALRKSLFFLISKECLKRTRKASKSRKSYNLYLGKNYIIAEREQGGGGVPGWGV